MPALNSDLHGNVPESADVALLLIDVINDMNFEGGEQLLPHALAAARRIVALKGRCRQAGIPTLYVNDNFGRWQSDFQKLVDHCRSPEARGREVARMLAPDQDKDYFVLKPKHSGFFSTTLDTLLEYLGPRTLILAGFTADICVLFTANDAYMRDYHLVIPADCVASLDPKENAHAIELMARVVKADVRESSQIDLAKLIEEGITAETQSSQRKPREA